SITGGVYAIDNGDFSCATATFFFASRRRHTRFSRDWSSDVCSSDLGERLRHCTSAVVEARAVTPPLGVSQTGSGRERNVGRAVIHLTGGEIELELHDDVVEGHGGPVGELALDDRGIAGRREIGRASCREGRLDGCV